MTATTITLRLARAGDAPAIASMTRDLIEAGLGWNYRPERIVRLIRNRDTIALVADRHGKPVGFAIMAFGDEHAHLVLLAVHPAQHRQGIARRMMDWLVESAAAAGIASLHLELRAGNGAARAFYQRVNFAETQLVPGYYRGTESAIRMERVLRICEVPAFKWQPPTLDSR